VLDMRVSWSKQLIRWSDRSGGGQTLVATRHLVLGFDRFTEVGVSPIGTNPGECKVDAVTQAGVRRPFARLLWALVYVTLRTARTVRTGS